MVTVYFEDKKLSHSDKVATFEDENLYMACLDALKASAAEHRMIVTESIS